MKSKTYNISLTDGNTKILLAIIAKRAETDSPHNVRYLKELQKMILDQIKPQGFNPPQRFNELYLVEDKNHD
ncbi:hypothetical protein C7H19_24595 [Aphanothece hegewaldii CCALA 016]|uniref:Uncharacterized protein n=1 Tax=Aphanothece hegewaldii CCALA 016 TaxID=2107694 RepID=A0A2T1LQL1_9CHRO|nr:hypothetical protein [Aphanothece hegewaldii]PSF28552.1 hypothetical protein C7H19_24595 [Aphanothece hegewaldii CCALA 016]